MPLIKTINRNFKNHRSLKRAGDVEYHTPILIQSLVSSTNNQLEPIQKPFPSLAIGIVSHNEHRRQRVTRVKFELKL